MDSPEFAAESQAVHDETIAEEIRNRKIDIVMKFIFDYFIDLNEELLAHDVNIKYPSDTVSVDHIVMAALDRLNKLDALGNYYTVKEPFTAHIFKEYIALKESKKNQ